jgi:adenine/guanine/hypoxanthine permease
MSKRRWWTAGDLAGFLGLGLDNLIQILLIVALGLLPGLAGWGLSAAAAANRE